MKNYVGRLLALTQPSPTSGGEGMLKSLFRGTGVLHNFLSRVRRKRVSVYSTSPAWQTLDMPALQRTYATDRNSAERG
jgi:hypothetical protein